MGRVRGERAHPEAGKSQGRDWRRRLPAHRIGRAVPMPVPYGPTQPDHYAQASLTHHPPYAPHRSPEPARAVPAPPSRRNRRISDGRASWLTSIYPSPFGWSRWATAQTIWRPQRRAPAGLHLGLNYAIRGTLARQGLSRHSRSRRTRVQRPLARFWRLRGRDETPLPSSTLRALNLEAQNQPPT